MWKCRRKKLINVVYEVYQDTHGRVYSHRLSYLRVDKDSREQFEQRTHKRLIDIITPTPKTVDALQRLEMPAGVYIDIKMKTK